MSKEEVKDTLIKFLLDRLEIPFGDEPELDNDTHLFDCGYIDSLDSLVLLTFLEQKFKVLISPDDLADNSLSTVNEITEFVFSRLQ
jgi:acyl carrier protein